MKIGVIGSRSWKDKKLIFDLLTNNKDKISEIVSGGAVSGADKIGARWARKNDKELVIFYPDKKRKHMYHYRNRLIAEYSDIVVAFWDGKSSGTMYTVEYAKKLGKKVIIVKNGDSPSIIF